MMEKMERKIKNYVGLLFEGVPQSRKAIELRGMVALANLMIGFRSVSLAVAAN